MRQELAFGCLLALTACSDPDQAPPAESCRGSDCPPPVQSGSGESVAGSGGDASGGSAADAGAGGDAGEAITSYTVARFDTELFDQVGPYTESATVSADQVGGGMVTANWLGSEPFSLLEAEPGGFVMVTPSDSASDALATLLQLPSEAPAALALPLVRVTVLQQILSASDLPLEVLPGRAQVALRVRDATTGEPIVGARFSEPSAEVVLYSAAGLFSNAATETDIDGLGFLANVQAGAWPGTLIAITISGTAVGAVPLRTVDDSITVLDAVIEP